MIALAAIDLRGGEVVQLVGGRPEDERVRLPDAGAVARGWIETGFSALHVVDLDAALGGGSNDDAVDAVLVEARRAGVLVQVGGGLRDDNAVADRLRDGRARAVLGTRAIEDPAWLARIAQRFPGRIVVAADVRGNEIVTRGWTERAGVDATAFLAELDALPLAAVLVTDVDREGSMAGVRAEQFRRLAAATSHPLIAAGGIGAESDLHLLAQAGADGAVLGMALYTGAVDAALVAAMYRTNRRTSSGTSTEAERATRNEPEDRGPR